MSKEIDKLLYVLDMKEEEQWNWVLINVLNYSKSDIHIINLGRYRPKSLADLAFSLRNELTSSKLTILGGDMSAWYAGIIEVQVYLCEADGWFMHRSQPIHWIIAALIAKLSKS